MGVEVIVKDSGATGLVQRIGGLGQVLTVGVHEDADPYQDGTPVATVLAVHEYGDPSSNIPERSVLRAWVDSGGRSVIANVGTKQIGRVVDGDSPPSISEEIGDASVDGITKRMKAGIAPELAPATLANLDRNQDPTPLIDTGRLIDSIKWEPAP